jgi:raffinose/stachyose/melibiose transport system substrate-binding protein
MKKCYVKLMSVFVVLTMLFTLTGFSQANGNAASKAAKKTKLTIWHIQNTDPFPAIIQDSVNRFMAANPQYDVQVVTMQNDAFKTKLKIAMSSNTMPDIFPTWTGGPMYEYIDSNKIADITAYMDKNNYKDKFMTAAINQATYKDKIWAVPVENVAVCSFFYNKEIFAKYNLQAPKTLKELETICDTLKSKGIIPFSLANKTKWTGSMYYMYLVDRIGGKDAFANAVSRKGSFNDPAFTKAGTIIQDWVKKDYFNEGFNGLDEDSGQSRTLLYTGKAAMTLMGSWFLSTVAGENKDFVSNVGSFSFPAVEGGKGNPNTVVGTVGDNFYSVAKSCKDVGGAFKLMTYLIDSTSTAKRIAAGRIPPLKGVKVSDPNLQAVLSRVEKAPAVQLWYDQYLPPELGEMHKDTSQALFGLTKTPEQVNKDMEDAAKKYFKK